MCIRDRGENPKSVYHDKDEAPVTRMATAALIREQLYKAKEYFSRKARAEDVYKRQVLQ